MTREVSEQPRRWMALHSVGVYELLMEIHASLEDFQGAVADGRPAVAVMAARALALRCIAVRAVAAQGLPPDPDDPLADPFAGLPADVIRDHLSALDEVTRAARQDHLDQARAAPVVALVRRLEQDLGFVQAPASIRRPAGLFPALRLARELLPLNRDSGFPVALPSSWVADA